jgi:hypothetical protein
VRASFFILDSHQLKLPRTSRAGDAPLSTTAFACQPRIDIETKHQLFIVTPATCSAGRRTASQTREFNHRLFRITLNSRMARHASKDGAAPRPVVFGLETRNNSVERYRGQRAKHEHHRLLGFD